MNSALPRTLALAAVTLSACTSYDRIDYVGESTYQLAEFSQPDGPTEIYELRVHPDGLGFLNIIREGDEAYQEIGLRVVELDKERAEQCNVRPYSGLLVRSVERDSAAARAGLHANDIVLTLNGSEVFYLKDYEAIIKELVANSSVRLKVRSANDPTPREVELVGETRVRRARDLSRVPLETPKSNNPKPYAGVMLRAVPKKYSKKIYGDDRNAIVISGVVLGSPAYLAGLRAGDIVEKIDGEPTPGLAEVMRILRERGVREEVVEMEVTRENTAFVTKVELEDYSGTTRARIPFVFSASSGARTTEWSAILGGALARYSNSYTTSKTREIEQYGSYSMLLGLIKYSWSPGGSRTRLLWFISFGS